jgi:hypothetical protein
MTGAHLRQQAEQGLHSKDFHKTRKSFKIFCLHFVGWGANFMQMGEKYRK